jgi:TetR/AcrR family transcriptional regulator, transcriptional repressor for nem operon
LTDRSNSPTGDLCITMGRTSQAKEHLIEAMRELIWVGSYAGTSVEDICAHAKVHKGSFYHYFASKSELAIAAIEGSWAEHRLLMDGVFSPTKPALTRLVDWLVQLREEQRTMQAIHGRILGCPIHTIGSELGGKEDALHDLLKKILSEYLCYLESTLRDAQAERVIEVPDATAKARLVFFYVEGLLTHARIWNDLCELDQMEDGVRELLGRPSAWPATSTIERTPSSKSTHFSA